MEKIFFLDLLYLLEKFAPSLKKSFYKVWSCLVVATTVKSFIFWLKQIMDNKHIL